MLDTSNGFTEKALKRLQSTRSLDIKYKAPLILRMYGTLNRCGGTLENRYILTNFLDKYSDLIGLRSDIYIENNKKSLNQLFLMAVRKAQEAHLLDRLYEEYIDSYRAISKKIDLKEK